MGWSTFKYNSSKNCEIQKITKLIGQAIKNGYWRALKNFMIAVFFSLKLNRGNSKNKMYKMQMKFCAAQNKLKEKSITLQYK